MADQWYYTDQGQRLGPISSDQLKQLAASGRLQPSAFVWKEGMAQWAAASNVDGLFPAELQAVRSSPPPLPPSFQESQQPRASGQVLQPCGWCTKGMPSVAVNCPHCGKLRIDIYHDKGLAYTFGFLCALPAIIFVIGFKDQWWHDVALPTATSSSGPHFYVPPLVIQMAQSLSGSNLGFSSAKFLSSLSGIFVLLTTVVFWGGNIYYYAKACKKSGTWLWI
jgi:hypothetical protein